MGILNSAAIIRPIFVVLMPLDDGFALSNGALADELEALNSIYWPDTLQSEKYTAGLVDAVLRHPELPFSFLPSFVSECPMSRPQSLARSQQVEVAKARERLS